ncbi:hypothetical protein GCM10028864_13200 [Microlunatus parietis]
MEVAQRGTDDGIRIRWAAAFLGAAVVLITGHVSTVHYDGAGADVLRGIGLVLMIIGVLLAVLGLAAGLPFARDAVRRDGLRAVGLFGLGAVVVLTAAAMMILPFAGTIVLIAAAVTLLEYVDRDAALPPPAARLRLALPFSLAVLALLPFGILHVLVWNPQVKLPGLSLDEIYGRLSAADQSLSVTWVISWAVVWGGAALAFPLICRSDRLTFVGPPRRTVCAGLILLALAGYSHGISGFSMGMAMADTFEESPTGGDAGPGATIIGIVAQLAVVAALLIGAAARADRPNAALNR